jgi:hypothetical protein
MNTDKVVPPMQVLKERQAMAVMAQQQTQKIAQQKGENEVAQGRAPGAPGSGQETMNGQPTTDNFQPTPQ